MVALSNRSVLYSHSTIIRCSVCTRLKKMSKFTNCFGVGLHVDGQAVEMDLVDARLVDVEHDGDQRQTAGVARQFDFLRRLPKV